MLGPHWAAAGLWSRYARHRVTAPCPEKQRDRFVSETSAFLARTGPVVAYPASERSIDALVDVARAVPERAQLPFSRRRGRGQADDKRELATLAEGLDLAVPTSWEGRADGLASASFPLPALIKARGPSGSPPPVRVVESPDDLRAAALELRHGPSAAWIACPLSGAGAPRGTSGSGRPPAHVVSGLAPRWR